jgi:hypothetical protein
VAAALLAGPALADDPYYPAAQCAAFWLGRDDYARVSTLLDTDPTDPARAAAFRAVAVRLNGGDQGAIDAFLATERHAMARLVEAYVYGGDDTSRDLHDRLLETCETFAATQEETRDLP